MGTLDLDAVVSALVAVGYGAFALWRGYELRRDHWRGRAWIGPTAMVLISLTLLGFIFAFSLAVDNREAWVGPPRSGTRAAWILISLGCMVGGLAGLAWFALGDPARPWPFFRRRERPSTDAHSVGQPNEELKPTAPLKQFG